VPAQVSRQLTFSKLVCAEASLRLIERLPDLKLKGIAKRVPAKLSVCHSTTRSNWQHTYSLRQSAGYYCDTGQISRLDCNELLQKFDDSDRDINGGSRGELSCDSLQTSEETAEAATGRGSESDDAGSSMRGAIVTVLTGFSVAAALSGMLF
jgi:hypothetical protein